MGRPVSRVAEVVVTGPLAPFAAAYRSRLGELGYTPLTMVNMLRLAGHLSCWLEADGLTAADLSDEVVVRYFRHRRASGRSCSFTPRSVTVLLGLLDEAGALPAERSAVAAQASESELLLVSFERFLLVERGLAGSTTGAYVQRARRFLEGVAGMPMVELTTADVTRAVLAESTRGSVGSTQHFVAALRALLRFCFVEGLIGTDLSAAAAGVTGRRRSLLPRGLSRPDAAALLASCDRRRADGRRDHAVLLVLLRLGLRAGEVATLTLDGIDWRAGQLLIEGKGGRADRLPLPADVGAAIAAYLQFGRPESVRREVFLRTVAPVGPLGRGGISSIVRRACVRAGVEPVGAHRLRHTAACEMVAVGVPLAEIGQVLRHRSMTSTAIYARVDVEQLRSLARPWPQQAARP